MQKLQKTVWTNQKRKPLAVLKQYALEQMKSRHFIITGSIGIGKTTLLKEIRQELEEKYEGYYTKFEKEILYFNTYDGRIKEPIAKKGKHGLEWMKEHYFDQKVVSMMQEWKSSSKPFIIMDEVGFLEKEEHQFLKELQELFTEKRMIVVQRKYGSALKEIAINPEETGYFDLDEFLDSDD